MEAVGEEKPFEKCVCLVGVGHREQGNCFNFSLVLDRSAEC